MASRNATEGSLRIHQDAEVFLADLEAAGSVAHQIPADRHVWLQVFRGSVSVAGETLSASDGMAVSDELSLMITGLSKSEIVHFNLA